MCKTLLSIYNAII
nr:unnamed protein product [Callosobruchus analis]